jgi:hypothetical protein
VRLIISIYLKYSIENLVSLLTEQSLQQFVMKYGCMTQEQKERLKKFGISRQKTQSTASREQR